MPENVIGLLFEIAGDPTKAEAAMTQLNAATVAESGEISSVWSSAMEAMTGPMGIALGGITALGGGMAELASKAAESGNEIYEASEKTGLAADKLSAIRALAKETGGNFDSLSISLSRAGVNLQNALMEPGEMTAKVLAKVMGGAKNLADLGLVPMDQRIQDVLQHIFALNDAGEREQAMSALMGRGWQQNVEVLEMLAKEGYAPAIEQAKQLGMYYDEDSAAKMHQFTVEWETLKGRLQGVGLEIGNELVPDLNNLFHAIDGFEQESHLSFWEKLEQAPKDVAASVLRLTSIMQGDFSRVWVHGNSLMSEWEDRLVSNSKLLNGMTDEMLRTDPVSLKYSETMEKIAKATELAKEKHLNLTQAMYDLAHGMKTASEAAPVSDSGSKDQAATAEQNQQKYQAAILKQITLRQTLNRELQDYAQKDQKAMQDELAAQNRINLADIQFLSVLDEIGGATARNAALARTAAPTVQVEQEVNATKHLSVARLELVGVTQDLHTVEDAFGQALHGDFAALEGLTQKIGGIAGQFAQMIGGTKAAAEVKGAFDAASAIECMAQFILSGGTDFQALAASVQYAEAAEQMFKVAGGGGGARAGGGGGGGGKQSSYGRGGGSGKGSGSGSGGGAAEPGGGAPTIHLHLEGPGWTQQNVIDLMGQMSTAAQNGTATLNATNALYNGPKLG